MSLPSLILLLLVRFHQCSTDSTTWLDGMVPCWLVSLIDRKRVTGLGSIYKY